jgi:hypothetical protein
MRFEKKEKNPACRRLVTAKKLTYSRTAFLEDQTTISFHFSFSLNNVSDRAIT